MSSESWALIGVVLGAFVGGVAQMVNAYAQDARARRRDLRTERRAAYTELLVATQRIISATDMVRIHRAEATKGVAVDVPDGTSSALESVRTAVATIQLVAPASTWAAADVLLNELMARTRWDGSGNRKVLDNTIGQAKNRFLALAKNDLGATPRRE